MSDAGARRVRHAPASLPGAPAPTVLERLVETFRRWTRVARGRPPLARSTYVPPGRALIEHPAGVSGD